MSTDVRWIDLAGDCPTGAEWHAFTIPGSAPEVRLARLHIDPTTGAGLSLVSFPPGWSRPEPGHYSAGEEFVLLRGDLEVSGERFAAGDWAWIPPGVDRCASASAAGALALAWFSGPARWCASGEPESTVLCRARASEPGPRRVDAADLPGRSAVVTLPRPTPARTDCDVLDTTRLRWCFVAAGTTLPVCVEPVLLRNWT